MGSVGASPEVRRYTEDVVCKYRLVLLNGDGDDDDRQTTTMQRQNGGKAK